jgi:hypothetical protein
MSVALKSRFPSFASSVPVYSVIVAMIYGWTVVAFIWKLPSWLNYLTMSEILVILSYSLFTSLFESLFILGLLALVSAILPPSLFLDAFTVRGPVTVLCLLGSGMAFLARYVDKGSTVINIWPLWLAITLLVLSSLLALTCKVKIMGLAISWLADQLTVFLYIFLPLSAFSTVVVLFRNIF